MQRILVATLDGGLHRWILPQRLHRRETLRRKRVIGANVLSRGYDSLSFL